MIAQQPPILARINRANPLTRSLVMAGYGAAGLYDIGSAASWTNNGATKVSARSGNAWSFNGSSTYLSRNIAPVNVPGGEFTLACLATPRGSLAADGRIFAFGRSDFNNPLTGIQSDASTASTAQFFYRSDAGTSVTASVTSEFVLNKESLLIAVATVAGIALYTQGRKGTGGAIGTIANFDRTALGCALRGSAALFYRADVSWYAAWNRALSEIEIQMLRANPWQLFASSRPVLFAQPSAAAFVYNPLSGRGGGAARPLAI
jgi:hypothetical protein